GPEAAGEEEDEADDEAGDLRPQGERGPLGRWGSSAGRSRFLGIHSKLIYYTPPRRGGGVIPRSSRGGKATGRSERSGSRGGPSPGTPPAEARWTSEDRVPSCGPPPPSPRTARPGIPGSLRPPRPRPPAPSP